MGAIMKIFGKALQLTVAILIFTFLWNPLPAKATLYTVNYSPLVLFGDSVLVGGYLGLENYTTEYVGGYLHMTYTITHGSGYYASYPAYLSVFSDDPTVEPNTTSLYTGLAQFITTDSSNPTDVYFVDIQFSVTGYREIVNRGLNHISFSDDTVSISGMNDDTFIALVNQNYMAFQPMRLVSIAPSKILSFDVSANPRTATVHEYISTNDLGVGINFNISDSLGTQVYGASTVYPAATGNFSYTWDYPEVTDPATTKASDFTFYTDIQKNSTILRQVNKIISLSSSVAGYPGYSNLVNDASEPVGSSYDHIIQTLGTNLSGTLTQIDVVSSNPSAGFYGSSPILDLYECDDSTYGDSIMSGNNCTLLFHGVSNNASQLNVSTQSFYTGPITLNPLKYYFFTSQGDNQLNALPFYYGSQADTVDGTCYRYIQSQGRIFSCAFVSDLAFYLRGVTKSSTPPACTVDCNSNVLFLPGIKGSILETGTDQLWPPSTSFSNDISQLALDSSGNSVNDVHVKGILNQFGPTDIYLPFSNFMDGLVSQGVIQDWLPMAYDWRFSPEKIIQDGIKTENGVLSIITEIDNLAASSKNGKVTIVTHSMGGLLGKAIIKELENQGKDNLIDSFVMVGTPQLGTPQAAAVLLHGDDEGIVLGYITNPTEMRAVAQNMPGAYDLLPSPKYFNQVSDPVLKFDPTKSFTQNWRDLWGESINNFNNFASFLIGADGRSKPSPDILQDPEVLNGNLVIAARDLHNIYDNYAIPSRIRTVQVAGWGIPTTKAINYTSKHFFKNFGYETVPTREGDGTVVYLSAISSNTDETYFFNVFEFNKQLNLSTRHRDLLSTNALQDLVKSTIKNEDISNTNFIFDAKPQVTDLADQLVISTNSPVVLGVYDQSGNFTGVDSNQDLSADILTVEEGIPGSTFLYTSEGQQIFLPKEGIYDFIYKGTGTGPTTIEIKNFIADTVTPITSYVDLPTTSNTEASFTIQSTAPEGTNIELDVDGDGDGDATFSSSADGALYFFSGFLQPINDTTYQTNQNLSVFKAGSTVPVKFQSKNSTGIPLQTNTPPVWLAPKRISAMNASVDESVYSLPATAGTDFRWDSLSQQYVYNWNTKGFPAGGWYKLSVKLDNGGTYNVTVGLR